MNIAFQIRNIRFHVGFSIQKKVIGVNSQLEDGKHFLLWDFDGLSLGEVMTALEYVQGWFELPSIYILNTGIEGYYHAYCFKKFHWAKAMYALASTRGIDETFFKLGVMRGYWTLRFSDKKDRSFEKVAELESPFEEDVNPYEISSFAEYFTKKGA